MCRPPRIGSPSFFVRACAREPSPGFFNAEVDWPGSQALQMPLGGGDGTCRRGHGREAARGRGAHPRPALSRNRRWADCPRPRGREGAAPPNLTYQRAWHGQDSIWLTDGAGRRVPKPRRTEGDTAHPPPSQPSPLLRTHRRSAQQRWLETAVSSGRPLALLKTPFAPPSPRGARRDDACPGGAGRSRGARRRDGGPAFRSGEAARDGEDRLGGGEQLAGAHGFEVNRKEGWWRGGERVGGEKLEMQV